MSNAMRWRGDLEILYISAMTSFTAYTAMYMSLLSHSNSSTATSIDHVIPRVMNSLLISHILSWLILTRMVGRMEWNQFLWAFV